MLSKLAHVEESYQLKKVISVIRQRKVIKTVAVLCDLLSFSACFWLLGLCK